MRRFAMLLVLAAAARGGDLRDALDAARQQEPKAAADAIGKALAARPSRDQATEAIAPSHWPMLAALAARPEGAPVVKRLLIAAFGPVAPEPQAAAMPQADDLAKAVVLEQDYAKRFDACSLLARCYGERATPCLLPYLKHDDTDVVVNAHVGIVRVGRPGVLPLSVAVRINDGEMRRFVAQELGAIDDPRALAVLLELAEEDGAGSAAAKAAAKLRARHGPWAADGAPAGAYVALSRRYAEGEAVVARLPRGHPPLLWSLADGHLVPRLADQHLYFIELGKRAARDALRLDPKNQEALDLLKRLEESEKLATKLVAESRR